ncbi:MAG: hypothetical protein ACXVNN_00375 [Bacteroidia bacterium]
MKNVIVIFISTLLFCSCTFKQDNASKIYYVIQHQKEEVVLDKDGMPPPPLLKSFYGDYNFILLDSSTIYCHEKNKHYSCGYGLSYTKPVLLFLTPEDLSEIKISNLEAFLKSIPESIVSDQHFYASISSPNDTIKNKAFEIIADFFKSKNIKCYNIRNLTEEEQYVLTAKLENKKYDPNAVDWKIGFSDSPNFLPTDSTDKK